MLCFCIFSVLSSSQFLPPHVQPAIAQSPVTRDGRFPGDKEGVLRQFLSRGANSPSCTGLEIAEVVFDVGIPSSRLTFARSRPQLMGAVTQFGHVRFLTTPHDLRLDSFLNDIA